MPNDLTKCPYCGTAITSKDSYYAHWECGSVEHGRDIVRSTQCKLNVANAEIEKLRGIKKHNADELDKCFEQQVYKDNAKLSAEVETLREELTGKHQDIELACHAKAEAAWKPLHDILEKHLDKSLSEIKTLREELVQVGIKLGACYEEITELKQKGESDE